MSRERSVSPVGASRFEQPYSPAPADFKNYSPSTPTSAVTHSSQPSYAGTMTTASTAPTSIDTSYPADWRDKELHSASPAVSTPSGEPDEWFSRFRSDLDLSSSASDECPDRATLAAAYDIPIYDAEGNPRPFGSLYDPAFATHPRQLVLFVRHFYCGACQAYLQALTEGITPADYFAIPTPTSIIVIGCGKPDLIPQYRKFTGCPYPIFADPTRALFKRLGMAVSLNVGTSRPEYMKEISAVSWGVGQVKTISKSLKDPEGIRKRDVVRGGNPMQIGGEFLFDDGEVVWCHRMRNYRNHAEIKVLRKLLELDDA